jgi:hypothetical protein
MSKPSQATLLVEHAIATDSLELFRSPSFDAYVMLPAGTHRECWPVKSIVFRRWLSRLFFEQMRIAPGSQALQDALGVLEGKALFEGAEEEVHLRLADHDGAVYLDLADDYWQAVKITASGWECVDEPPVKFRRARGMLSLPYPTKGGSLDELREYVNIDDEDWPLFLGWLVGALRPRGPYAVLLVHGEQGSAKSTLVRVARALVDPNEAPVRREPRNGQDLIVAARNGLVVCFDNVSHLSQELSDDLARLATGSGFGARQLYTDLDEVIVHVSSPIILNGIEEVATRGDLLDRGLILSLPPIERYQDEDAFWRSFTEAHPRILGALLDAVSTAIANHDATPAPNVRMADFARFVTAAEPALGLESDAFITAYRDNRSGAVQLTLESSPLSTPVITLAATGFEGTATELLEQLNALVSEETRKQRGWPKQPHTLGGRLRRLGPALRRVGVKIDFERSAGGVRTRKIRINQLEQVGNQPSRASRAVPDGEGGTARDARDGISQASSNGSQPLSDEEITRLGTMSLDDLRAHEEAS